MKNSNRHAQGDRDPFMLNVLLAYDTAHTHHTILGMLNRVSNRARAKARLHINAFNFGLLEQMDPCQSTAAGARAAELAVVAFGEAGAPGARLLRWLEKWGRCHEHKDAALGLVHLGRATGQSVRRFVGRLQQTAARHGLDFIYDAHSRLFLPQARETVVA
jgi:hypothetical protein